MDRGYVAIKINKYVPFLGLGLGLSPISPISPIDQSCKIAYINADDNLLLYSPIEILRKVDHLLIFLAQLFITAICAVTESSDT